MMRSLYSGVAGLKTHQTRMDVIGNNIANVNTTAYKSQSMTFSDLMYQTTQSASGANAATGTGGTNARQIGLGSKTSAIKTAITTQGASQTTNDPFDMMITGDNFFIVSNGTENMFTRDGSFYVDGVGNLCMTSTGYNVMGWLTQESADGTLTVKQDIVQPLQIMADKYMTYPPEATSQAQMSGIVDSFDTNVANDGKIVTLDFYDNLGFKYTSTFKITNYDPADTTKTVLGTGEFFLTLTDIKDPNGNSVLTGSGATYSKKIEFDPAKGALKKIGGVETTSFQLDFAGSTIASFPPSITVDCQAMSNLNNNGASTVVATRGSSTGGGSGRMLGEMSGISIQKDGMIYATYDNGQSRLLGQIATAAFANASGLAKEGDNLYSATQNSGDFDGIGVDITAGGGYMNSGVLEMSNVDLSAEFTEMITTQRGFQANSRIITVSDTLLEELTNLKR